PPPSNLDSESVPGRGLDGHRSPRNPGERIPQRSSMRRLPPSRRGPGGLKPRRSGRERARSDDPEETVERTREEEGDAGRGPDERDRGVAGAGVGSRNPGADRGLGKSARLRPPAVAGGGAGGRLLAGIRGAAGGGGSAFPNGAGGRQGPQARDPEIPVPAGAEGNPSLAAPGGRSDGGDPWPGGGTGPLSSRS